MLDRLEVDVLDLLDAFGDFLSRDAENERDSLRQIAHQRVERLESLNEALYESIRARIRSGELRGASLRSLLETHSGVSIGKDSLRPVPGYDTLDVLLNGIFSVEEIPDETRPLEPGMVYYQKTPGRVILELGERAGFQPGDLFYDLGSGLGQVPILVHLLAGVRSIGIEMDRAYVRYSKHCADNLGLTALSFRTSDVRDADLSDGTVFFLYTPFTGKILETVLEGIRERATRRPVRLFSYGPCSEEIAKLGLFTRTGTGPIDNHRLELFV